MRAVAAVFPAPAPSRPRLGAHAPQLNGDNAQVTLLGHAAMFSVGRIMELLAAKGYSCSGMLHDVAEHKVAGELGFGDITHERTGEKRARVEGSFMRYGKGPGEFTALRFVITTNDPEIIRIAQQNGGNLSL